MSRKTTLLALALFITSLLPLSANLAQAANNVCNAGIGGTGILQDGIGGTGIDSGVGGTGKQANSGVGGTGIVGIITGFASVCVNGLEVHYDNKTKVDVDGQSASIEALNIGQLVAIESVGDNQLKAERISVTHVVIGKIEQIDYNQHSMQVLGQTIYTSPYTLGTSNLSVNQVVKVSGLVADNQRIYAMRIDQTAANATSTIVGTVDQAGAINGVKVLGNYINNGRQLQVSGTWDGKVLRANQVQESPIQQVLQHVDRVVIQDMAPSSQDLLQVQNRRVQTDVNTKTNNSTKSASSNQTVIVRGRLDRAGNISTRSIEYTSKDKVLERGGSKQRPSLPESSRNPSMNKDKQPTGMVNSVNSESHDSEHKLDKSEFANRPEKLEKTEKIEKPEKIELPEKVEKIEKPEKIELPEKVEKIEKPEKIELPEKVEKIEKPEKIEIPEKIQLPERVELPQRAEIPEKIEVPETSRH